MLSIDSLVMNSKKRFLFLGPTGVGKSTLINILHNDDISKEAMLSPASVGSTSKSVTKNFNTYYSCNYKYAYTDSIGFGDDTFTTDELVALVKELIDHAIIGYNRIYLCVQYGRVSVDIWRYLDLIVSLFGENGLNWCTMIFTHCNEENMTKELFLELNKNDEKMTQLVKKVDKVIFGDLATNSNPRYETMFKEMRQHFLNKLREDRDQSSDFYYFPEPKDHHSWLSSVCYAVEAFNKIKLPFENLLEHLKSIKVINVSVQHHYGECVFCLEPMYFTNSAFTDCDHIFHSKCIADWLYQRRVCPICDKPCVVRKLLNWLPNQILLKRPQH